MHADNFQLCRGRCRAPVIGTIVFITGYIVPQWRWVSAGDGVAEADRGEVQGGTAGCGATPPLKWQPLIAVAWKLWEL